MKSGIKSKPRLAADSRAFALLRAAEVIAGVIGGRSLDAALSFCWQAHEFSPAQRGAVQDLAYGTLRQYGRGDFLLSRLLRSPLQDAYDNSEARLQRALLLAALYRLEARPADAHTTVDQAVNAAAGIGQGQFRALTNAVLRNRLRRNTELLAASDADPVACCQHPRWWMDKIQAAYPEHWQSILAAGNSHPPMTLRVNRRRSDGETYLALLREAGIGARLLAEESNAILLEHPQNVDKLPGFSAGLVTLQDWGAQRAAPLLDVQDGMRVLDACAAPGGKATHLLELADIDLLALDPEQLRTARIVENLDRLDLHAEVKTADCRAPEDWWDARPFERILADVPCSAAGVVRRHPDIKWLRRESDIEKFARTQAAILDALWHVLAPGGKMLYCTCSLFPEENELQMASFTARHVDALRLPVGEGGSQSLSWQLLPHAEQDGFYYALLRKNK
ncbi:MAG: 16S rRNA (cytosine(967)-C(5))-methyltransferase RsmB [Sterolibacterium sp.]